MSITWNEIDQFMTPVHTYMHPFKCAHTNHVLQVTHSAAANSSTKGSVLGGFSCYPDCGETDASVPIYNAYNHHYFSWLVGKDAEVYDRDTPAFLPNPT